MEYYNNYPTVFMSGLGGWGEDQLQNKIMPYWGKGKNNVLKDLRGLGYECLFPSLGPLNSSWDRVCILWAWLFGGTVDFGKAHAEKYGISRYGRTYEHGALEDLGQPGPHQKANFIGHSMGGPLIKTLSELFVYGSEEERAVTPEDELSPLFKGGHGHLIHCLTTLSGTNNGTTLADFPTNYGLSFITGIFAVLGAVIGDTFMSNVYYIDLRTPGRYVNVLDRCKATGKVSFVKGKVANLEQAEGDKVTVQVEDAIRGEKLTLTYDLVVLATGMQPTLSEDKLPLPLPLDDDGFVTGGEEAGIFAAGCAVMPLDVTRSAQTGTAAALKAVQAVKGR